MPGWLLPAIAEVTPGYQLGFGAQMAGISECHTRLNARTALGISIANHLIDVGGALRLSNLSKRMRKCQQPIAALSSIRELGCSAEVLERARGIAGCLRNAPEKK